MDQRQFILAWCGDVQIWYAGMGGKGILADEPLDLPNKLLARPARRVQPKTPSVAVALQPKRVILSGRLAAKFRHITALRHKRACMQG